MVRFPPPCRSMKLQPDRFDQPSISGYGPGWVGIDGERVTHSVVIASQGQRFDWNCGGFAELDGAHFERLAALDVEMVIFGSGARLRFPRPDWIAPLVLRQIGLETMDTQAACRTYNILAGEGRRIAAALLLEAAP